MQQTWQYAKMANNVLSPSIWAKTNKVYALFGPLASPRRYANFPGMFVILCLPKVSALSQIFPPLA
jgi:hypothetical protein